MSASPFRAGRIGGRTLVVSGIEIYAKTTPCAHSCRYCLIGNKALENVPFARFATLVERFIDWRATAGHPDLPFFLGLDHSFEFDVATLKGVLDLQQRAGWAEETRGIRLGGLVRRSTSEIRAWLRDRRDGAGIRSVHASLAGYGAVHDRWNGRQGDFELLLATLEQAAGLGLRPAQRLFLVKSTLPGLEQVLDRLEAIPGEAERYLSTFFYRGLATRHEAERITERIRDTLPARLAVLARRDEGGWRSEREWIDLLGREDDGIDRIWLRLEVTADGLDRLDAESCEAILAGLWRRTLAAYQNLPDRATLLLRYGDAGNDRIYGTCDDVERLWLDRHLQAEPTRFERRLTHLTADH